mmetsp:Transcript_30678/g.44609  ORF Transcript_30678/g.44609 Transcript_30678/m.44609 type:complete len:230 (-) Transcript_30678:192-881(-)
MHMHSIVKSNNANDVNCELLIRSWKAVSSKSNSEEPKIKGTRNAVSTIMVKPINKVEPSPSSKNFNTGENLVLSTVFLDFRKIIYGIKAPPPTTNPARQNGKGGSIWCSSSCSNNRDQTAGTIKKVFSNNELNPRPDPKGGSNTMEGFNKLEISTPSSGANQRESGLIPGAKYHQKTVSSVAKPKYTRLILNESSLSFLFFFSTKLLGVGRVSLSGDDTPCCGNIEVLL